MALRSTENTNLTKEKGIFVPGHPEYRRYVFYWTCCLGTALIKWQQVISTQRKINSCSQMPSLFQWEWYYWVSKSRKRILTLYLECKYEYSKGKTGLETSLSVCILKCFKVVYIFFSLLPHFRYKKALRSSHLSFLVFLSSPICSFQFLGCCSNPAEGGITIFFCIFFFTTTYGVSNIWLKLFLFSNKFVSQSGIIIGVLCQLWGDKTESQWIPLGITKNVTTSQCTLCCEILRNQVALTQIPDENIQQLDIKVWPQIKWKNSDTFFPCLFQGLS